MLPLQPRARTAESTGNSDGLSVAGAAFSANTSRLFVVCPASAVTVHDAQHEDLPRLRTLLFMAGDMHTAHYLLTSRGGLLAAGGWLTSRALKLKPPTEQEVFFPSDHMFTGLGDQSTNNFLAGAVRRPKRDRRAPRREQDRPPRGAACCRGRARACGPAGRAPACATASRLHCHLRAVRVSLTSRKS